MLATSIVTADTDIDDETLVAEYNTTSRIGQEIFGALDTGGLEDVGEDEDGDVEEENRDLSNDSESGCPSITVQNLNSRSSCRGVQGLSNKSAG